jgi:protein TonB
MRLSLSFLAAIGLHGALFGVAAAVLSRAPADDVVPVAVALDVEVMTPKSDPVADAAPGPPLPLAKREAVPPRPHVTRHVREVTSSDGRSPRSEQEPSADPTDVADVPAVAAAAPTPSHSPPGPTPAARGAVPPIVGGAGLSGEPRYRSNPKPDYPIASLRRGEEGIVLVNVMVRPDGTAAAVSLNRSCGHPLLDRAALDAVRRWTFEPALAGGVPVAHAAVAHVRFSVDDQP